MQSEVSYEADRILFAYCEPPTVPDWDDVTPYRDRYYRLYEIRPGIQKGDSNLLLRLARKKTGKTGKTAHPVK